MLALIAGTGDLPPALMARLAEKPLVCALAGFEPVVPVDIGFRLETLGTLLETLKLAGVTQVCMAGAIQRPQIDPSLIDETTKPLVPQVMQALRQGDDGALRAVIGIFEGARLTVRAAHDIAPDLLPPTGVLTQAQPDPAAEGDAQAAEAALVEMGRDDLGQACVVGWGRVLAREWQDGTDAMLARLRPPSGGDALDTLMAPVDLVGDIFDSAADWLGGPTAQPLQAKGALLFKGPKPDQDRRADLPVIGPKTVDMAAAVGLRGVVIESGGVMVLDRAETLAACDRAGLFLWVRPRGAA